MGVATILVLHFICFGILPFLNVYIENSIYVSRLNKRAKSIETRLECSDLTLNPKSAIMVRCHVVMSQGSLTHFRGSTTVPLKCAFFQLY